MTTAEHATQSHHLPAVVVAAQQRKAVLFFILADAVFFGCLLFSYFYLRALDVDGGWLPKGAHTASGALVWITTAITIASAVAYRNAERSIAGGDRSRFLSSELVAMLLVVVAIAVSIVQISTWPLLMSDGSYASSFIVMSWVQLVHLLILVILGIGIGSRGRHGRFDDGNINHVTVVGYFWYWVTLTAFLGALTTFFVH